MELSFFFMCGILNSMCYLYGLSCLLMISLFLFCVWVEAEVPNYS